MIISRPLVVLDLETTGTWIEKDRIVEIALIKCLANNVQETYVMRVNPGIPIPSPVSQIIGITDEDVKDAKAFKEIASDVFAFIADADLAGFNLERFDLPILEREMFEAKIKFEWRTRTIYDAQKIYHHHEKRDLKAAYQFYVNRDLQNAHSALGDAQATLEILAAQLKKYGDGEEAIETLKDFGFDNGRASDFYDTTKKFRWWNGELYPTFGKYQRKVSLKEIVEKDREYLEWILTKDFNDEVKKLVQDALSGELPIFDKQEKG